MSFTSSNRRGLWILLILIVIVLLLRVYISKQVRPKYDYAQDAQFHREMDFLEADQENKAKSVHPEKLNLPKENRSRNLVEFDPNLANENTLTALGFTPKQVENILNYRKKGGSFRKKEDLKKLYTLSNEQYALLEPYILIPDKKDNRIRPTEIEEVTPIDLNEASSQELMNLRGIGTVLTDRILKYRSQLGGFVSPSQLLEIRGIEEDLLNTIQKRCYIDTNKVKKLSLNKCTFDELSAHPYISYYQAKAIAYYRNSIKYFSDIEELRLVNQMDEETYKKIIPYIIIEKP